MTNPGPLGGDRPLTGPDADPFAVGETPPAAVPSAPAYERSELLDPTPAYDALAEEAPLPAPTVSETAVRDADYHLAPNPSTSGALSTVRTLASDKPAVFLGVALFAGWLVGKIFLSSDDDE